MLDALFDKRTDRAQFNERTILREESKRALGPEQRVARSAPECPDEDTGFNLRLPREQFGEFGVRQRHCMF